MTIQTALRWMLVGAVGVLSSGPAPASPARPAFGLVVQDAKADLEKRYTEIGGAEAKDANAVYQLALWADQNNLKTDSKRLLRQVIKLDTDHAEARAALGYEKYEGKWLTKREIDREKAKKEEEEKLKLGLKKWKGEWVPADDYTKYEKGLVPVDDHGTKRWVTEIEKQRIDKGMTLYKGQWVTAEEKDHLDKNEFKVGDKWVPIAEADKAHADFSNPWILEGDHCALTTTKSYEFAQKAVKHGDATIQKAYKLLNAEMPKDLVKVGIIVVELTDYNQLGQGAQDNDALMSSNWGSYVISDPNTSRFVGIALYAVIAEGNQKANDEVLLGNVRHAAAAATLRNVPFTEQPPPWFTIGMAVYCERCWHPEHPDGVRKLAKWSKENLDREGGMLQLKNYFDSFAISRQSVLQSGLLFSYLQHGQLTPKLKEYWTKVQEDLKADKQKGLGKDFAKLEIQMQKEGDKELDAYTSSL